MFRLLIIILCCSLYANNVSAQTDNANGYSEDHPLIIEDSEAIWPYSFINDAGKPDGYCIDIIKTIMRELNIPYEIRLKSHQETLKDLKTGKADVVLGLADVYEDKYGHYGRTTLTLLTQSVATPRGHAVSIKNFRDLKNQKVYVKDSSLCHHLMVDYGWGNQAIVCHDPAKALQAINDKKEGQMVWNTLTLKWLINHFKLKNLTLTPVNMPHGETKFISNNLQLLEEIDNTYTSLNAAGKLEPLEEKWFHPNYENTQHHSWIWFVAAIAVIILIGCVIFLIYELRLNRKITRTYHHLTKRLHIEAEHNKMRFWTYHIDEERFEWYDDNGMPVKSYSTDEFSRRYNREDFEKLNQALDRLINEQIDAKGHEEKEETLELKAKDSEYGDGNLHDFVIHLSILSRDALGKPSVIIGAKKDITKEHLLKQLNTERSLRYLSTFYNNDSGILFFNNKGILEDANPKAGELLNFNVDEVVEKHTYLNSIFHTIITDLKAADGNTGKIKVGERTVKYSIKTVCDDLNQLIGIFVFCI